MRRWIQSLSHRTEFVLITAICFTYFIAGSLYALLSGIRTLELSTSRVSRAIAIELVILLVAGAILRVRGWTLDRLGLRFSWKAALAGVPLAFIYLLVFAILATFVQMIVPSSREAFFSFRVTAPVALMLVWIVINSFFEELAVTAYVLEALSRETAAVAISASTLLRFTYHLYQGPYASLSIIPVGLLFATLYAQRRNVWPLVVAHTIANLVSFAGAMDRQ